MLIWLNSVLELYFRQLSEFSWSLMVCFLLMVVMDLGIIVFLTTAVVFSLTVCSSWRHIPVHAFITIQLYVEHSVEQFSWKWIKLSMICVHTVETEYRNSYLVHVRSRGRVRGHGTSMGIRLMFWHHFVHQRLSFYWCVVGLLAVTWWQPWHTKCCIRLQSHSSSSINCWLCCTCVKTTAAFSRSTFW